MRSARAARGETRTKESSRVCGRIINPSYLQLRIRIYGSPKAPPLPAPRIKKRSPNSSHLCTRSLGSVVGCEQQIATGCDCNFKHQQLLTTRPCPDIKVTCRAKRVWHVDIFPLGAVNFKHLQAWHVETRSHLIISNA